MVDVPPVSEHAADRWDERTDPRSVAPETAWEHAQRLCGAGPIVHVSEVRFHHGTGTLLLYEPPSITTVLAIDEASDELYHAIKHALPDDDRRTP